MSNFSIKGATTVAILGGMIAGAVSASAALNLPTMSCSYMFNTNMRLGSRGADVMNLQKVLNMYPQTQVSASGAGSPGMETSTFGPATRAAVNKFQALHLVDLGITAPTGNVFAGTRGLLNQVCNGSVTTNPTTPGTPATSGPISAMLGASQPTGTIVAGQAGALLANLSFSGNGTVTNLELQRIGVSADTVLNNVYLYDGNTRITDAASVTTGGYVRFNASNGLFAVNGSRTISVRADILSSAGNGQTVGVKLNSVTAMGSSASSFANVMGNTLNIATVTTSAVNFSAINLSDTTVDAGTQNYTAWEGSASVSTRDVNFKSATFKFVGSAPVDAMSNLSLFVDGTKVSGPATINAMNNNKITFDFGASPYLLRTGAHTISLRGDVIKGSARNMTFSVENVADLMFEDRDLSGVNVSATGPTSATQITQSFTTYRKITVNAGSVTTNVDPAFVANKVTGGATSVPIGSFTMKAYGEDVKVQSLVVTPAISGTANNGLANVSLYVNGAQVGTNQNWTSTTTGLTYTLGSSMIIPAGQTVTVQVKADIVNPSNSAAYTAGTLSVTIGGSSYNAQGQNSNEIVSVAASAVTGNSLTVSSGAGTFARTSGFTAVTTSPNTGSVKIGSFTLQADSSENIRVNSIGVNPAVTSASQSNISNLTLKVGSTVLGTPVGNPAAGTTTFSFNDVVISANGTQTFDVYADVGGDVDGVVTTAMEINYRGVVSNTNSVSSAAGVAITSAVSSLASPTLNSSSEVAQFVVGSATFPIATFKLSTAVSGTQATVRELRFRTTGTDAIQSITVGGVTASVISGGTTTVSGLNIVVGSTGTDVPVTATYSGFQNSTKGGSLQQSIATTKITLGHIEATSGSGTVITNTTPVDSNVMSLVASKPTVSVSAGGSDTLNIGALSKIGEFTVTADANGKIALASTSISISTVGITSPELATSTLVLKDGTTAISDVNYSLFYSSTTPVISFTVPYEIPAGTPKVFSLYGTINGTAQASIVPRANTSLNQSSFKWIDVIGSSTMQTGTNIKNFPTNSYTTKY